MDEGPIEQILLHLYECTDASFSYRAKKMFWIDDLFLSSNWNYKKKVFQNSFNNLKRSKFIALKKQYDGSIIVSLTEKGKLRALNARFRRLGNKNELWDKKWRMIAFDIPNTHRKGRDAIRYRLQSAGFYELQESMFVYPYNCEKEIRDLISLFNLEKYVRLALIDYIDGQENIKKRFELV
jgi:DNA-binding transcriptional regulator PaaX